MTARRHRLNGDTNRRDSVTRRADEYLKKILLAPLSLGEVTMGKVATRCSHGLARRGSGHADIERHAVIGRARQAVSIALFGALALGACVGTVGPSATGSAGGTSPAGTGA